jgi:hypothetical protein
MSTYETIMLFLQTNALINVVQMSRSGKFACSERQIRRVICKAKKRGVVTTERILDEQGRPLCVKMVEK